MIYTYPVFKSGDQWNIQAKCFALFNKIPTAMSWDSTTIYITFEPALTDPEKAFLDSIMADPNTAGQPGLPAYAGSKYGIKDAWDIASKFFGTYGSITYALFVGESIPGSGVWDQLQIHFSTVLTTAQKNTAKNAFTNLMTEKL